MEYSDLDKIILWISLSVGIGSNRFFDFMNYFGDIENIWNNFDANDDKLTFLTPKMKLSLSKTKSMDFINKCLKEWKYPTFVTFLSPDYPSLLKEIDNPPLVLYYKGKVKAFEKAIAVVGSRKCTRYGVECAKSLSYDLASLGITVVSGGARGIDAMAHQGALDAGGRTICVLGCGIDVIYPSEHEKLFSDIVANGGAIISEYSPGERPSPWHFPERNRIISGITSGVIVAEAHEKSGALITANISAQEGRDVFCIPGNITSLASKGTNNLIKNGATLVDCADDVMFQCGWHIERKNQINIDNYENLNNTEKTIVNVLTTKGQMTIDDLCVETGIDIVNMNITVTGLEILGVIKKISGNILTV